MNPSPIVSALMVAGLLVLVVVRLAVLRRGGSLDPLAGLEERARRREEQERGAPERDDDGRHDRWD